MVLKKRGGYWYGDAQGDIRDELRRYSELNGYAVDHYADCVCECGSQVFELDVDETNGVGDRVCKSCGKQHVMADGEQYLAEAEMEQRECVCGQDAFEITAGVHLYREPDGEATDDVRWFYIGCRCIACGLVGCYADWKNEFAGYQELLNNV